jgi:hypothetical protein
MYAVEYLPIFMIYTSDLPAICSVIIISRPRVFLIGTHISVFIFNNLYGNIDGVAYISIFSDKLPQIYDYIATSKRDGRRYAAT